MNALASVIPISLDQRLLDDVIASVATVFRDGFGVKVNCISHHIGTNQSITADVSGLVGLTQDHLEGNLVMAFPESSIYALLSRVYARDFHTIDRVVQEGAAELANMVYGHVKMAMNGRGHGLKMTLPTVVVGHQHSILSADSSRALIAAFEFDSNRFHVVIGLHDRTGV